MNESAPPPAPTLREAARLWLRVGLLSFGGPAAQIAMLHEELVEKRQWVAEDRFQHALRYCTFLPGPEAQQLAACCGWFLHGIPGGLVAGILFFLPAAFLLWLLSWIYAAWGQLALVGAVFHGLKAAVLAILLMAVIRLAKKSLKGFGAYGIALLAMMAFEIAPFPLVIVSAALAGWLMSRSRYRKVMFPLPRHQDTPLPERGTGWRPTLQTLAAGLAVWWAPILAAGLLLGKNHWLTQQGLFFGKAACVTFGGAYAVLPYVAHHAVEARWITETQTLDGLALAETTPGPLIIVLEFFGFQGGWKNHGAWPAPLAGTLGAAMTVWATFVPSTFFALLGAPHLEKVRQVKWLTGALAGVSCAVIGVVVWLGLWMAGQSLFGGAHFDWFILLAAPLAFAAMHFKKAGMVTTLLACAAAGVGWKLLGW